MGYGSPRGYRGLRKGLEVFWGWSQGCCGGLVKGYGGHGWGAVKLPGGDLEGLGGLWGSEEGMAGVVGVTLLGGLGYTRPSKG